MATLYNGDCFDSMKLMDNNSVDLIFCDLPYGQTSCKWDCLIDLDKLWIEFMRIKKLNTPIIMTCTTRFGLSLLNSCPKKCPFRYDLVWCKSASAGFLCAKKMPMRKHEMIYVFYEKLPFYDLSSHKHKFIKENTKEEEEQFKIDISKDSAYGNNINIINPKHRKDKYKSPLPTSLIKEDCPEPEPETQEGIYGVLPKTGKSKEAHSSQYDPPLPNSLIKEDKDYEIDQECLYGNIKSVVGKPNSHIKQYEPALPNSLLEIKSTRGKHSTEKPVALMEWILKYYSKEGDNVFDPTMGSGSMGVACGNMNRNFIGIEKDAEIYQVAVNRIEE